MVERHTGDVDFNFTCETLDLVIVIERSGGELDVKDLPVVADYVSDCAGERLPDFLTRLEGLAALDVGEKVLIAPGG